MNFAWLLATALVVLWLARSAATEMCKEEIRTRLSLLPNAVLRLAAARLPRETRQDVSDEWRAELAFVLQDTDGLPITRVLRGTRFALGLLWAAASVARELSDDQEAAASPNEVIRDLLPGLAAHRESTGYMGPAACAAAGITYRQLDYWARRGLLEPSLHPDPGARAGSVRFYSSRDIVLLGVIKRLLDSGISLMQLHAAVVYLRNSEAAELDQVTLMSDGVNVHECTSPDEVFDLLKNVQNVFGISLGRVQQEILAELSELPKVDINTGRIVDTRDGFD